MRPTASRRRGWLTALALTLTALVLPVGGCATREAAKDTVLKHSDFAVGMTRAAVRARFGPPEQTQEMVKANDHVWGPIESFWARVPMGGKVEIWSYRSKQWPNGRSADATDGSTELYFVNGSDTVDGIGFAVEGAVY